MNRWWFGLVPIVASFAFAAWAFPQLPEQIPTHWGLGGRPDGWGDRWPSAFIAPGIALATWLLLAVLPRIGPRRGNMERHADTYWLMVNVLLLFFTIMTVVMLGSALGWPVDVTQVVLVAMGLMFAALGNYLPRVRSNWWMGIRTPWTLDSETVWRETHRVGGRVMLVAGVVATVAALLLPSPVREYTAFGVIVVSSLVPLVYSYVLWRREGGR